MNLMHLEDQMNVQFLFTNHSMEFNKLLRILFNKYIGRQNIEAMPVAANLFHLIISTLCPKLLKVPIYKIGNLSYNNIKIPTIMKLVFHDAFLQALHCARKFTFFLKFHL